jgi:ElaB/YqjD/DUF883 family membrane-anchored ribosome-binding protein
MNETTTPATDMLASMAHNSVDGAADLANSAEKYVRGAATRTAEQARELQEQVVGIATEDLRKIRSYVQENPLAATCIAVAAGVLISTLIRR